MLLLSHRLPAVCELGDLPHGLHVRPTGNERSIHLIWGLQLLGLPLLYAANQIHPLALAVMLIPICIKIINYIMYWASAAQRRGRSIWAQPSPCHLLTQEEYQMQGEVETRRAVKELRKYCQSPEINVQAIRRRLRSPESFAAFLRGASHLTRYEVIRHEQEYGRGSSCPEEQHLGGEIQAQQSGFTPLLMLFPDC
ncbi:nuclear envelope integral membrane protein 1-like [Colius striatus]|uniref:nuclear envelope integral membrane protein 1-like n=1 Tax=Colius striatus TaxID=57412 RepID=UPI002B1D8C74|nr:nuclear envelope integral membrane protein 1-like isoform X2 [Colius striatus]XP_061871612.1 nuclear envelope integral membrane protein 1-like [Colius striatus]